MAEGTDRREERDRPARPRAARVQHRGRYGRFWFIRDALAVVVTGLVKGNVPAAVHVSVMVWYARMVDEKPGWFSRRSFFS